ncbi:MAG: hypothetical protein AB8F34_13090 [Akkermansiaceae bacterium]
MEPEEAFRLIDHRGVKHRALNPGQIKEEIDAEDKMDGAPAEAPKWIRYTIISIATVLALTFLIILGQGAYLLYDKKEPIPREIVVKEPPTIFSDTEIEKLITERLKAFLDCTNTQQRLLHVLTPKIEQEAMYDYYEQRGNLDKSLWKVELIKSANLEGTQIWMVAYQDVAKAIKYVRFERAGNEFLIQWSSSYGYSQLSWNEFARSQPRTPVQMRCFVLHNTNSLPPGIDPSDYLGLTIENKRGEFTSTAIMKRNSKGARMLLNLPLGTRNPVNLLLRYKDLPNGTRQLTVDKLLHFQWYQSSSTDKGRPLRLK